MSASIRLALLLSATLLATSAGVRADTRALKLPQASPLVLKATAKLMPGPARENSGIVRSRSTPDLFWMQNDSSDEPRIYPVRRNGSVVPSHRKPQVPGVLLGGALNVDWEAIAVDSEGHIIVGDLGNNRNDRRDLLLYYVDEPSPTAEQTVVKKKLFVRYPQQTRFPAPKDDFNYDSEGIFTVGTTVYVLTKHRSDTRTRLYRLESPQLHQTNDLVLIGSFDAGGKVTGADATADGKKLVMITYDRIWLFETEAGTDGWFDGRISWRPYQARGVEAVAFLDDETLVMASEPDAELYEVPLSALKPVQR
ncbi:MAG: hypothetical protein ACT4PG_02955 [Panacagrimonas sp.]